MNMCNWTLRTHATLPIPYSAFPIQSTILKRITGIARDEYIENNDLKVGG
jgi:hypothetical protein